MCIDEYVTSLIIIIILWLRIMHLKSQPCKGANFVCKTAKLQVEVVKYVIINSIYTHEVYTHKTMLNLS